MSTPEQSPLTTAALSPEEPAATPAEISTDRRAALAKLGALGAWTAPVMLTLLASQRASAVSPPPDWG